MQRNCNGRRAQRGNGSRAMTKQGARLQHCSRGSRMEVKADDEAARRGVEDWSKDDASGWGRHLGAEGAASQCFDYLCVRRRASLASGGWCRGGHCGGCCCDM
jgi:hypothetical protein